MKIQSDSVQKGLLTMMCILLLAFIAVQGFLWWLLNYPYPVEAFPERLIGWHRYLELFCIVSTIVSISGLILARSNDDRRRAFYVLGLTAIVPTYILLKPLTSLNLNYADPAELTPYCIGWTVSIVLWVVLGTVLICKESKKLRGKQK